jgi:hypothetical protein
MESSCCLKSCPCCYHCFGEFSWLIWEAYESTDLNLHLSFKHRVFLVCILCCAGKLAQESNNPQKSSIPNQITLKPKKKKKKRIVFVNFYGINTLSNMDFNLLIWNHWIKGEEEIHMIHFCKPVPASWAHDWLHVYLAQLYESWWKLWWSHHHNPLWNIPYMLCGALSFL